MKIVVLTLAIAATAFGSSTALTAQAASVICGNVNGRLYRFLPGEDWARGGAFGNYVLAGRHQTHVTPDNGHSDQFIVSVASSGFSTGELIRVGPGGGSSTIVTNVGSTQTRMDENGDLVLSTPGLLLKWQLSTRAISTLLVTNRMALADRDIASGDWAVCDGSQLLLYDPTVGAVVRALPTGIPQPLAFGVRQNSDDAYAANDRLFRINVRTGAATTLPVLLGTGAVADQALAFHPGQDATGGFMYVARRTGPTTNWVLALDRNGVTTRMIGPFGAQITAIAFEPPGFLGSLRSRPFDYVLHVSFPSEYMRRYVVAVGLSGSRPGIRLNDGRLLGLNPDAATMLGLAGRLAPILTGESGTLSLRGRAQARLDLTSFGQVLSGVRLWAVAVTFEPNTPRIAAISHPVVIVL